MRQIEIGPITTDWYKPGSDNGSLIANLQLERVRIITGFYGRGMLGVCRQLMAGTLPRAEAEVADTYFLETFKQVYNLPKSTDPRTFYMDQHKAALALPRKYIQIVPELAFDWEGKDELADLSDRPIDLLRYLAGPADPVLTYEAQRHAILMYQLGTINARTLNSRLRTISSDVNRLLNKKLFKGPDGYGRKVFLDAFHDDDTNQVVGFPDRNNRRPLTAHPKRVPLTVRQTYETGEVRTHSRKKDDCAALVKSWVKALKNGGIIHINMAVQDSIGREFVLMDDAIPPGQFADLVVSIIQAEAGVVSDLWEIPKMVRVVEDDKPDDDHGQSSEPPFNARRQIWFENIPTPYELKIFDRETYLNAELEVGTRDPETGLYRGRNHDLFDLRKYRKAVRVPFPEEIYPVDDYTLNMGFVNISKQKAFGLRNIYKAA